MTNRIQLEPEAQAFAEAEALSPLPFTPGPEKGRLALDEAQSGRVRKHPVTDAAFDTAFYHLPLPWEEVVPTLKQMIERKTNR